MCIWIVGTNTDCTTTAGHQQAVTNTRRILHIQYLHIGVCKQLLLLLLLLLFTYTNWQRNFRKENNSYEKFELN